MKTHSITVELWHCTMVYYYHFHRNVIDYHANRGSRGVHRSQMYSVHVVIPRSNLLTTAYYVHKPAPLGATSYTTSYRATCPFYLFVENNNNYKLLLLLLILLSQKCFFFYGTARNCEIKRIIKYFKDNKHMF